MACEKAALTARLRASQQRVAKLEKQAQALSEHGAEMGGMGGELDAGGDFGTPSKLGPGMRRRGAGAKHGIAAIPVVAKVSARESRVAELMRASPWRG